MDWLTTRERGRPVDEADRGASSASIPITLARFAAAGTFNSGALLVLIAFGGGMAIDVALYRWP